MAHRVKYYLHGLYFHIDACVTFLFIYVSFLPMTCIYHFICYIICYVSQFAARHFDGRIIALTIKYIFKCINILRVVIEFFHYFLYFLKILYYEVKKKIA